MQLTTSRFGTTVSLQAMLNEQAELLGHKLAYAVLGDDLEVAGSLSFEQTAMAAWRIREELLNCCAPGDRVLLALDNGLEAIQLFWGCVAAGLVPIPAPSPDTTRSRHGLDRLRGIIFDAGVSQAWTSARYLKDVCAAVPQAQWHALADQAQVCGACTHRPASPDTHVESDALAYLQYTSGSTSQPRGVMVSHAQVLAQCSALHEATQIDAQDARSLTWLPWFHDFGLVHGVIQPMAEGMSSFIMPTTRFLLKPLKWLEVIDRHRITHSGAPDFAYAACVKALARNRDWSARLDSWCLATCGAEPVRHATMQAFAEAFEPFGLDRRALSPCYGLAEAVLGVAMRQHQASPMTLWVDGEALAQEQVKVVSQDHPKARPLVCCGPALPGFQLRIVNPDTCLPCPPDHVGEIWVAGPSVGGGYWQQEELSRTVFHGLIKDDPAQQHYLRTGDLGFLSNGQLFVTGRRKDLIVVHGRNLYPQDLELSAHEAHPGVRAGGVVATTVEDPEGERIVLLVECQGRTAPEQVCALTNAVQQAVSREHEVGVSEVVALRTGSLPRTSSGKLMRSRARQMLLAGELDARRLDSAASAPETCAWTAPEQLLADVASIWCEVLGTRAAQPQDDFLHQGGDSLLATQLVSRIRARLGVALPLATVFECRTLGALVEKLASIPPEAGQVDAAPFAHDPAEPGSTTPTEAMGSARALSFSQERMWFMHQIAPGSSAYHIPLAIRLRGRVRAGALRGALQQIVQRHNILRTTFVASDAGVQAVVSDRWDVPMEELDLIGSEESLMPTLTALSQRPFDLAAGPLLRAQLLWTAPQEAVLIIVMHHLVSDQWSCSLLGQELAAGYSAAMGQDVTPAAALPVQYADYASWHRRWFDGFRRERELTYWSQRLVGLEPLTLNEDHPRPQQPSLRGSSVRLPLSRDEFAALSAAGAAHGASLSMVLMAALNVLLFRHTGSPDLAIGVPIANRNQLASEHLIGTFVNTLVLRTDLSGNPSVAQAIQRVRDRSLEAFAHQDMPFEVLVRELGVRHDRSRSPLFNVMFNMVNAPTRNIVFHGLEWSRVDFDREATQFDLAVLVDPQHDPGIVFEYATDLFERQTIERMAGHLRAILRAVVQAPDQPILSLDLIDAREMNLLEQWSRGPDHDCGLPHVGAWLERGARLAPDGTALIVGGQAFSHRKLDERSSMMASVLRRHGVGPGVHVGVCVARSAELVVALMALLKAGAAYVPLDPSYPVDRLAGQARDAGVGLMLACQATASLAHQLFEGPTWVLDDEQDPFPAAAPPVPKPTAEPTVRDAAYLIYTSGSTGAPKGVVITHAGLLNFLHSMAQEPGLQADDRLLAVTTVSFDIAALEILLPLGCGATIVMADESQGMDGRVLAALIDRHHVNVMQATPSRWHLLLETGWPGRSGFKALVGGEALSPTLATDLQARCAQVWNMYGPTETTVWSTCWRVDPHATSGISLGRPIANTCVRVLDSQMRPCPVGVMGDIWIGGDGLALGYHRQPGLTRERFVEVPQPDGSSVERLYRTGDLGRWRADGSLQHAGRTDDQVKLRGFRVELGEIETRLGNFPGVQRAVAAIKDLPGTGPTLVAYLVCAENPPATDEVRHHLRAWLPEHMIPTHCMAIEKLPLLANGKTDRKALPLPVTAGPAGRAIELPRNNAEQLLWEAWSEVLGTRQLGIHDDFFDIGGHSMLAVRLAARLERALGRPVPLALIFSHTTIAACAAQLTEQDQVADLPVAALQPVGEGPPLFLLAGADMYRALARELAPDIPVYGLFSTTEITLLELAPEDPLPAFSVRSLSQEYLALVRSVQPRGPYRLGGFSIGGVIAHELAQMLREQGETIDMLVLLDCALPGTSIRHFAMGLKRRMRQVWTRGWRDILRAYRVVQQEHERRQDPGQRRTTAYAQAIREHHATPGEIPALFLQAGGDPSTEPAYGWTDLIPGLRIERVPGRHMDILEPPNVSVLVAHLRHNLPAIGRPARISEPALTPDTPP